MGCPIVANEIQCVRHMMTISYKNNPAVCRIVPVRIESNFHLPVKVPTIGNTLIEGFRFLYFLR
jgi:hypothetical protein